MWPMNMLRADIMSTRGRDYDGARCTLSTSEVVEVSNRRTPLYDLARGLEERGYSEWKLQAFTPTGTPSLRGPVEVMAGLAITERDKAGLKREKYRPFPLRGALKDGHQQVSGAQVPEKAEMVLCGGTGAEEAA